MRACCVSLTSSPKLLDYLNLTSTSCWSPAMNPLLEKIVGPIHWAREGKGFITCPGEEMHTAPTRQKDCILYLDTVPTIFCLHRQCKPVVAQANVALRQALRGEDGWTPKELTPEQKERYWQRQELERKARRLARHKDEVLAKYDWPLESIVSDSEPVTDGWHQFLNLWPGDDIMWSGQPHHSGQFIHADQFRRMAIWQSHPTPPHHFVCGSAFRPGTYSRTKDCVAHRRFSIIECDDLHPDPATNKNLSGAVLNFLRQRGWTLRAVIDSGNKSIHGWFDYPGETEEQWATHVLPALNVDTATLRPTQPVRAPGIERENGNLQKLLWIK